MKHPKRGSYKESKTVQEKKRHKWTRHWRYDRRIWEDVCEHGVGHCNDIHGCDGCCAELYKPE